MKRFSILLFLVLFAIGLRAESPRDKIIYLGKSLKGATLSDFRKYMTDLGLEFDSEFKEAVIFSGTCFDYPSRFYVIKDGRTNRVKHGVTIIETDAVTGLQVYTDLVYKNSFIYDNFDVKYSETPDYYGTAIMFCNDVGMITITYELTDKDSSQICLHYTLDEP